MLVSEFEYAKVLIWVEMVLVVMVVVNTMGDFGGERLFLDVDGECNEGVDGEGSYLDGGGGGCDDKKEKQSKYDMGDNRS